MPGRHAVWVEKKRTDDEVVIEDQGNHRVHLTVTNDAEYVVWMLLKKNRKARIIYIDSEGDLAELVHDGEKFVDFGYIESVNL